MDERIKDYRKNLPVNLKGEGMKFSSPAEVFLAFARCQEARRPRPHQGAAADREEGHQRSPLRQGQDPRRGDHARFEEPARPHHRGPGDLQRHPQAGDGVLRPGPVGKHLSRIIADCYQILGRRADDRAARPHEGNRLPRIDPQRPVVLDRRPQDAAQQGAHHPRGRERKSTRSRSSTSAASSPSWSATTRSSTCGPTPATRSPSR